jgi:ATP-dependent DNA ligase
MKQFPILYKRSNSKEHINQWQIEVDGSKFRTTTGFVGMKLFTGDFTECTPKNVGKKNATTAEEQALFEANALWQKRKDLGYHEDINNCDKKVFFQPMLAQDYDKRKNKIKFPILSQPKLDGIRCIAKADGLWTRNGKEIISAPHIFESLQPLFEEYPDLILDGELYTSNKDVDFNTIISCVRKTKPTPQDLEISKQYIEYHVYDLPNLEGEKENTDWRLYRLLDLITYFKPPFIKVVEDYKLYSFEEIDNKLAEYISQGYEGQILRDPNSFYENKRSSGLLKHKTFHDEEFTIIGYAEGVGKFSNKLATLRVDVNGVETDCTINGTMEYLTELFQIKETLIGKQCTVKYFEKTVDGSLRFPKVIQIDRID